MLLTLIVISSTMFADPGRADTKAKPHPLKTCVVSGEVTDKGSMKPHSFVYEGQEVKLCCKSCLKDFNNHPKKYIKKIEEAAKKDSNK